MGLDLHCHQSIVEVGTRLTTIGDGSYMLYNHNGIELFSLKQGKALEVVEIHPEDSYLDMSGS